MIDRAQMALYRRKAEILKALGHPLRVATVDLLKDGPQCVCVIAEQIGAERSNLSRHLAVMLKAGVLTSRKEGLQVYYELRTPCIINFLNCAVQTLKHNISEDARILKQM